MFRIILPFGVGEVVEQLYDFLHRFWFEKSSGLLGARCSRGELYNGRFRGGNVKQVFGAGRLP